MPTPLEIIDKFIDDLDNAEKIYCSKCAYLRRKLCYNITTFPIDAFNCSYSENTIKEIIEDFYDVRYTVERYKRQPEDINKNNDCKWYKSTKCIS